MTDDQSAFTPEMLGVLFVLSDGLLLTAVLWGFGLVPLGLPIGAGAVTVALLGGWALVRWRRLTTSPSGEQPNRIETLKQRYATGDLSESAFEARLERELESKLGDERAERSDSVVRRRRSAGTDSPRISDP